MFKWKTIHIFVSGDLIASFYRGDEAGFKSSCYYLGPFDIEIIR